MVGSNSCPIIPHVSFREFTVSNCFLQIHLRVPKRPSPPNAIFHEENWAKFHEKHPKMGRQKLFTFISKKYQALPDEEKVQ